MAVYLSTSERLLKTKQRANEDHTIYTTALHHSASNKLGNNDLISYIHYSNSDSDTHNFDSTDKGLFLGRVKLVHWVERLTSYHPPEPPPPPKKQNLFVCLFVCVCVCVCVCVH